MDLLNKTNEARQIQLGVEQSLYGLERAKNQKTTQVVENGEIVYREDIDASGMPIKHTKMHYITKRNMSWNSRLNPWKKNGKPCWKATTNRSTN